MTSKQWSDTLKNSTLPFVLSTMLWMVCIRLINNCFPHFDYLTFSLFSAYRIPDIIKRSRTNITIATFADHWGYKKEAFQADPRAPKILYDAGIPVAFKSDHPVLNAVSIIAS
jgi:hypothetical protein